MVACNVDQCSRLKEGSKRGSQHEGVRQAKPAVEGKNFPASQAASNPPKQRRNPGRFAPEKKPLPLLYAQAFSVRKNDAERDVENDNQKDRLPPSEMNCWKADARKSTVTKIAPFAALRVALSRGHE